MLRTAIEHHRAGRVPQAEALYREVLQDDPDHPDALHLLGLTLHSQGQIESAVESIGRAIARKPTAAMHYNLGVAQQAQGDVAGAIESYRRAIALEPVNARALSNLGVALRSLGCLEEAEDCFRRSLQIDPNDAGTHCNLGVLLQGQGRSDTAIECFRAAIAIDGNRADAFNNLGNALRDRYELDAAVAFFRKAIALNPSYADAHNNLGIALREQGKAAEAVGSFVSALELDPGNIVVPWNLSFALLMLGQLDQGWAMYDWRLRQPGLVAGYRGLPAARPSYSGQALADKTILLWAEQGVGDEIMFTSVLPDVIRSARRCVIECDPRLVSLYARSFPAAEVIPKTTPPHPRTRATDIDWQCPVGSVPRWFRPTLESFPWHRGHLVPDAERVAFWKARLDALGPGPKVGVSWRSRQQSVSRNVHYTRIEQWGQVFAVPGLTFVNLQYDDCRDEIEEARRTFGTVLHRWDDLDQMNQLDDVAALMRALDLVIGPSTAPTILAAAAGTSSWMMLTEHSTWETFGTQGAPLFPAMRIVWRPRDTSWDAVLGQVAAELASGRPFGETTAGLS